MRTEDEPLLLVIHYIQNQSHIPQLVFTILELKMYLLEDFTISDGEKAPIQFYVYLPWAVGEHAS